MLSTGSFKVKSGYLTAFLLLLISYLLIFYTLQQLLKQAKWVEHTDNVIYNLEMLLSSTTQAESSARGYILLNDTTHLNNFYASSKKVDSLYKTIDNLVQDNTEEENNADTLKNCLQGKMGSMYRGILMYQQQGNTITPQLKARGENGKVLMNNIKSQIRKMEDHERNLLALRKEKFDGVSTSINIITITSLIIALLLSVYSFVIYSRESNAKLKSMDEANSYRKELEKKVGELESANDELIELRSIEKFAATGRIARTIAHEIRNPLTNISLASEQIKAATEQTEETSMLLEMINRNTNRINLMISELLTSTKFAQLLPVKMDVNMLVEETVDLATDRFNLKQIRLEKNYTAPGCMVEVDADKMKIALLNIIVNAIEAMESEKGVLEITTKSVRDKCLIEIKDNGQGMNEETMQKLFEPYFTNKLKGAGLGLTNTQNIVLNHKGSISVSSKVGEGSTFTIMLNIA